MITIRYFARLREALGTGEETVALPAGVGTVADLMAWLRERGAPWSEELAAPAVLIAVDQEAAKPETRVADGAEIAFFPPVTGAERPGIRQGRATAAAADGLIVKQGYSYRPSPPGLRAPSATPNRAKSVRHVLRP